MNWLSCFLMISICILGKCIKRRWSNLLSIFSGFYGITLLFANMRINGINAASDKTSCVLLIGVVSFSFGYFLVTALNQKRKLYTEIQSDENTEIVVDEKYVIRQSFVIIAVMIVFLYSMYRLVILARLLKAGWSYKEVRTIYFNGKTMLNLDNASRYGMNRFDVYFVQPLLLSLILISNISFSTNRLNLTQKQKSLFIGIVFLCVILTSISNGGREIIFYFIVIFAFSLVISGWLKTDGIRNKRFLSKKQKILILFLGVIAILTIVVITFKRKQTSGNYLSGFSNVVYSYFTGYVPHLNVRLNELSHLDNTYGYAYVLGLIKLPAELLHRVFALPFSHAYSVADGLTSSLQERVSIGGGHTFNAYVSLFYYFFRDFGFTSLIVESFFFGVICSLVECRVGNKTTSLNLFIYLFCCYLIISSMVRWEMVHPRTAMVVYYILFFFKRNQKSAFDSN